MNKEKIKIYFFTPFCILRTSTNRIFDMRMCDGFAGHNVDVTLVYPYQYMKENIKESEVFSSYGIEHPFRLRKLPTPLREHTGKKIRFALLFLAYFFATLRIMAENMGKLKKVVIVSREVSVIMSTLMLKKIFGPLAPFKVVPHLAEVKNYGYKRWAYRNSSGILPNVSLAKEMLMKWDNIAVEKMCVMYAPVMNFTKTDCSKEEARKKIKYDSSIPLVVYTGKVGKDVHELNYLLDAAALLPHYQFIFTGGKAEVVKYFQQLSIEKGLKNTHFTGFFNDSTFVRYYQLSADVLVSYYTTKDHMVDYNFPQKLQEYISTGNPCVTPNFGATRDVINEGNVFFVEPDNPRSLADGIKMAVENKELAKKKAEAAFEVSKTVSFEYRTGEFLEFFARLR